MTFKVGDYVAMKYGAPYVYTQYKSTGTVIVVKDDRLVVEFDYMSGEESPNGNTFTVEVKHVKLIKRASPQELVCYKIKQMEERWRKFQSSKKASCHV